MNGIKLNQAICAAHLQHLPNQGYAIKSTLTSALMLALFAAALSFSAMADDRTLEDRVSRLERMADNPVLLQMTQRLGDLQSQIQLLQDENDRLKRKMEMLDTKVAAQYKENDERLNQITTQLGQAQLPAVAPVLAETPPEVAPAQAQASAPIATPQVVGGATNLPVKATVAGAPATAIVLPGLSAPVAPVVAEPVTTKTELVDENEIVTQPPTQEETDRYQAAFALMKQGEYQQAIDAFAAFRKSSPQSALASNVSYWSGEAYLILEKFDEALVAFLDVVEVYPNSGKAPAAMLRGADTYKKLGKNAEAKALYQSLIAKFPDDRMSKKAQARMADLP